jgi:imidazolonepropionase
MKKTCEKLFFNLKIASLRPDETGYGELFDSVVATSEGKIVYIGREEACPFNPNERVDGKGQWMLPGFIDCHTHLVFAGNRADEFEQRLNGVSYADIAKQGGGIKRTVAATRNASEEALFAAAVKRAKCLLEEGVTSVEIKSGYGLDLNTEITILRVAKQISDQLGIHVSKTYLGAHATPPEFVDDPDGYIDYICETVLPEIASAKLADAVDVFCESIGFSTAQCERIFNCAKQFNLPIKAHVEQLSDQKGAVLASQYNAQSVDHIEYLAKKDIPVLARAGTVAVILPGAFYYLNETQKPPIQSLRDAGVPMAVATDLNPGSSPVASLLLSANMACVLFGLTPLEAIRGITCHAAQALQLRNKGSLVVGNDADFCLWSFEHPNALVYEINQHKPSSIWIGGEHVRV